MKYYKKIRYYYTASAVILLNTLLLFISINYGLSISFLINEHYSRYENPVSKVYGNSIKNIHKHVYPQMTKEEIETLLFKPSSSSKRSRFNF